MNGEGQFAEMAANSRSRMQQGLSRSKWAHKWGVPNGGSSIGEIGIRS